MAAAFVLCIKRHRQKQQDRGKMYVAKKGGRQSLINEEKQRQ